MEVIKKKIKQAVLEVDGVVIPDLNASYYIQVLLNAKGFDLGFFDAYVDDDSVESNNAVSLKSVAVTALVETDVSNTDDETPFPETLPETEEIVDDAEIPVTYQPIGIENLL